MIKPLCIRVARRPCLELLEDRTLLTGNLIYNGDFELGNKGFLMDYTFSPGDIRREGTYDLSTDPRRSHEAAASYGDHTSGAGLMMVVNGATKPDQVVWSQTVP